MENSESNIPQLCSLPSNVYREPKEAAKRIPKLEQDYLHIFEKYVETTRESLDLGAEGGGVDVYRSWIEYCARECKWMLNRLQAALDKLSSQEASYKDRKSRHTNARLSKQMSSQFLMLHGSKSLAEEKKLLRQKTVACQQQDDGVCFSTIDNRIWLLERKILIHSKNKAPHGQILGDAEKLQKLEEEAALKGMTKDPFCSMNSLEKKIKLVKKTIHYLNIEILDAMREHERIRKKHKDALDKKRCLVKKCDDLCEKWNEEFKCILGRKKRHKRKLRKDPSFASFMDNARRLAQKEYAPSIEYVSWTMSKRFMPEWKDNESFRNDYKERLLASLYRRGLGIEEPMMNPSKIKKHLF